MSEPVAVVGTDSGLKFEKRYADRINPVGSVRDVRIKAGEKVIFEQDNVNAPRDWSDTAVKVVASKYFHGEKGTPQRESSVYNLVDRVSKWVTNKGVEGNYFNSLQASNFRNELYSILINQIASFNSPVWFNVGVKNGKGYGWTPKLNSGNHHGWEMREVRKEEGHIPQCSACFIQSVEDTMEGIMRLATSEAMLFRLGSGTGSNFSTLREKDAKLSNGGRASGPMSFMKGLDAFAGVIKSGGKTRRAAKMAILDSDHPDVEEFIECKEKEEDKARALIAAGYDGSMEGEAYSSIFYQNANNSVRVDDRFMESVEADSEYPLIGRYRGKKTGQTVKNVKAKELFHKMAKAAHRSGDPGIQFDTTINSWHTCPNTARINASNPCSEYMFLDDSACNLASINLMKFWDSTTKTFDVDGFCHVVDIMITAQEIMVDNASYPTKEIAQNSHDYRPLGLGYANLGALLMVMGVPYDSDKGRFWCSAITSLMGGRANLQSSRIAAILSPFPGYDKNRHSMQRVMDRHRDEARKLAKTPLTCDGPISALADVILAGLHQWEQALITGGKYGFRNAQVTVIAPTGTIGFMMDCATTGIEPEIALVKYKNLSGGGSMTLPNPLVELALTNLGYSAESKAHILEYIEVRGTIEDCSFLQSSHLPIFDCAFKAQNGTRSIAPTAHVLMMAAAQPFLSGAISKTVNLPSAATIEDIEAIYMLAWKKGLKSVAVYRDGSKDAQPLNTGTQSTPAVTVTPKENKMVMVEGDGNSVTLFNPDLFTQAVQQQPEPYRRKLPIERQSWTRKFSINGHDGYFTVGMYEDGEPGELFISLAKEGTTLSGLLDGFGISISHGLQHGVPLEFYCNKFIGMQFEPCGYTGDQDIPYAKSIYDFIFQWMRNKFLLKGMVAQGEEKLSLVPTMEDLDRVVVNPGPFPTGKYNMQVVSSAPFCSTCGTQMTPNGTCWKCSNCGGTTGC